MISEFICSHNLCTTILCRNLKGWNIKVKNVFSYKTIPQSQSDTLKKNVTFSLFMQFYKLQLFTDTGSGRNSELIINTNNILLKAINENFSTIQFTIALNLFLHCFTFCVQCLLGGHHPPECFTRFCRTLYVYRDMTHVLALILIWTLHVNFSILKKFLML